MRSVFRSSSDWSLGYTRRLHRKRKRYTEEQIISILKEADKGAAPADLCRKHGMSNATFYAWRRKFGGMEVNEAKRMRDQETLRYVCEGRRVLDAT